MYMSRLFPKNVDPSGRISASAFVRTLQSRLFTGTAHKVADQRHTRPPIPVPPRFVDAKIKTLTIRARAAALGTFAGLAASPTAAASTRKNPGEGGAGSSAKRAGILELLSVFKGRSRVLGEEGSGAGRFGEGEGSESLAELRRLREYGQRHKIGINLVEKLMHMFKMYDSDHSGFIDKNEFRKLLMHVLKVNDVDESDLDRAWRDYGGGVNAADLMSLDDFIEWYKGEQGRNKNVVAVGRTR
jgi:hypothetical protein